MSAWMRIGRVWKAALLVAVGAAGGGAALAVASVPGSDGVIHACYLVDSTGAPVTTGPNLRIIDPRLGQACTPAQGEFAGSESTLSWNQIGLRGARGPAGKSVTVAGGHTFTVGHTVVTVGFTPSETVTPPRIGGHSKPIGTVKLGTLKFNAFSVGLSQTGGGGIAKPSVHEIVITKKQDQASAKLEKGCVKGQHFDNATITARKAGGVQQAYATYKLTDVIISSYQVSSGGGQPTESLSLNFSKIEVQYKPQNP